jgi:hypothetical protein
VFRFVFFALAIVGIFSIFSGALGTAAATVGGLALFGILALKLLFVMMIFGFFASRAWGRDDGPRSWRPRPRPWRPRRQPDEAPAPSREEQFEDWHRLAHAREEVDSWVEDLPDDGRE